tara:strand:- start:12895 stop:13638 length:744 start_codon:yes stop_codon:yes gene_type:complete
MEFITRKEWGAIESGKRLSPFRFKPVGIVVHHTTGASSMPAERVKSHDHYHTKTLGWKSIGYNFLIGENGEIFEGRGWHQGAATRGWNWRTISLSYIGSGDEITEKGKEGIRTAVEGVRKKYGDHLWIKCHRDFAKTYCPSNAIASWIKAGMPEASENPKKIDFSGIRQALLDIGVKLQRKPLRKGSRGKYVQMAQTQLNARLPVKLVVDGIYGKNTKKAVLRFQKQHPIVNDGVIGPVTWRYLWTV